MVGTIRECLRSCALMVETITQALPRQGVMVASIKRVPLKARVMS